MTTKKGFEGWRYIGPGFIAGYPAKDISIAEAARRDLNPAVLDASKIYKKATAAKKAGD